MTELKKPIKRSAGRKPTINGEDIIQAALRLTGPNRSISSLSLREITREAGIAPNSFYRHFESPEHLAITIIELAGSTLRDLVGQARFRSQEQNQGIVRSSVETFIDQIYVDQHYLPILLREGVVGSDKFQHAVREQLSFFQQELTEDLIKFAEKQISNVDALHPALIAKGITRLVFAMGADALEMPKEQHPELVNEMVVMIKMLITGAYRLNKRPNLPNGH